jgi:hypothetical protein
MSGGGPLQTRFKPMTFAVREPVLHPTPVSELRPTQMTLGLREVKIRRQAWRARDVADRDKFFAAHMVPTILGPGKRRYLIDHHHLVRALSEEGVTSVFVATVADLTKVDEELFWNMMDYHGWTHPFDAKGRRCDYAELPKTVANMEDDPYRSLAGELRKIGGFAKDSTPYSEFVWADFFRKRIKAKKIADDFDAALHDAMAFAKSEEADYLPGWCAPRHPVDTVKADAAAKGKGKGKA